MSIKKDVPGISTTPENKIKTACNITHCFDIKVSESNGAAAIFDFNNQLYDNSLISKDCYVAIEAVVAEHMNCSVEDGE